jgi:hypothetical protein
MDVVHRKKKRFPLDRHLRPPWTKSHGLEPDPRIQPSTWCSTLPPRAGPRPSPYPANRPSLDPIRVDR